jgi:predicted amino acid racemase
MQELVEVGRPHKPEKDNCVTLPHECVSQCESPHTMLYAVIKIFRRRVTKVEFRFYNRSRLYNSEEMIPHHTYIINENVRMLGRIQLDSTVTYLGEDWSSEVEADVENERNATKRPFRGDT